MPVLESPVSEDGDNAGLPARPTRGRAEKREDWYVIPAQFALRLVTQPDTSDEEPRMLLVHPDRLGNESPRRKLPRRARGAK